MRTNTLLCFILSFATSASMACQPLSQEAWEDSPKRVKSNFDSAQFVVVAQVVDVRKASVAPDPDSTFKVEVERATFRVERSFKGRLKPGETFLIDSGISSCGRGVMDKNLISFVPNTKARSANDYPKRWLIYYSSSPAMPGGGPQLQFEITSSPRSRPAHSASYDIDLLMRSASLWSGARKH
jgi:hypothetical protein